MPIKLPLQNIPADQCNDSQVHSPRRLKLVLGSSVKDLGSVKVYLTNPNHTIVTNWKNSIALIFIIVSDEQNSQQLPPRCMAGIL
jgi:hypothetical protein